MTKIVLLVFGCTLLAVQNFITPIEANFQFLFFIVGILLLGIPHGAADFLVASENADLSNSKFSKNKFFLNYLGRLLLFWILLSLFPMVGTILFILFAAFHFGETDLYRFKTNTISGKIFVITYGLVILSVIILHHFEEAIPLLNLFEFGEKNKLLINWLNQNRYLILTFNGAAFFISTFIYFLQNSHFENKDKGQFLIRFAIILIILFNLPMLLAFTFYFVIWHSLLSLTNIVNYLKGHNTSYQTIAKQILLYSSIAIIGICLIGLTGYMFANKNAIAGYIFLGLAVLTAPHMEVMYEMYKMIRNRQVQEM